MNFCVNIDNGAEIHGYFVPDGFSTVPKVHVRLNDSDRIIEVATWILVDGARAQGLHETGNVGFILSNSNVPGLSSSPQVELSDPDTGLVFYRRPRFGQFIPKKVLRLETAYIPQSELDQSLKPHFQFFEQRAERYGFETVRQMLEIIHQRSVYVSGRIILSNFRAYIDYNIEETIISLGDPFYELATRLIVMSQYNRRRFSFIPQRDAILFKPVMDFLGGFDMQDEESLTKAIRTAPKDTLGLLSSPFTHQLIASSPTDVVGLEDVSKALDTLSQFTFFDAGDDRLALAEGIADLIGLPASSIRIKQPIEAVQRMAELLRQIPRLEHLLEADLVLYHFIQKAQNRAAV